MSRGDFDEEYYLATNPDVAWAVRRGEFPSGWHHYLRFGLREGRRKNVRDERDEPGPAMGHRRNAARLLSGQGLEVGALETPYPVQPSCKVTYCDRFSAEEARRVFPELEGMPLQSPDVIADIDREGLGVFADKSQDFVILSHVIEHVANPIACVKELFRVTRPGGQVLIAAPDKRFNLDSRRGNTSFPHVLEEYRAAVTEVSAEHYFDLIATQYPEDVAAGVSAVTARVAVLRQRAEHAHVWDSDSFREFLALSLELLAVRAECVFESAGNENQYEYLGVWTNG